MKWNNPKKKERAKKKSNKMRRDVACSRERQRALLILNNIKVK